MANKNLIFDFYNLNGKDKSVAAAKRYFARAGATVTSVDVDTKIKKIMGVESREVQFGFADSQTVSFGVTGTGDIYQIKVNGKLLPMKNQEDHVKAIAEIVVAMERGRSKFQAALAKAKVELPPSIRTAAPKLEHVLREKISAIDEAIGEARQKLALLQAHSL